MEGPEKRGKMKIHSGLRREGLMDAVQGAVAVVRRAAVGRLRFLSGISLQLKLY